MSTEPASVPSVSSVPEVPEYRTVGTREVYRSRWMRLREDEIVRADGTPGRYGVLSKADFVIVIPRHEDGSITLVEQYRYPVGERCLEFPQGADEHQPDLDPLKLARQELAEETGLRAATVELIGRLHHAYGYSDQDVSIVLATGLSEGPVAREVEEQGMTLLRVAGPVVAEMMLDGRIRDCTSVAAYGMLGLREAQGSMS
jgi:ADP-ribose pyrophosphatase